jgi:anthranilate synthase component 2
MKILVIDNYDSFVYNLVHILYESGVHDITILKNNIVVMEEVKKYDKILLSPGPGIPSEAGYMPEIIKQYASSKSILGVCLGHQAIGECFGSSLTNLKEPLHGVSSELTVLKKNYLFENCPEKFLVGHYHSWVIDPASINHHLEVTAVDSRGYIMAIRHIKYDINGVQFHPESVLTQYGNQIILNWIKQ